MHNHYNTYGSSVVQSERIGDTLLAYHGGVFCVFLQLNSINEVQKYVRFSSVKKNIIV